MQLVVRAPDVEVAASPEQVWDVLADFSTHGEWSPNFRLRGRSADQGSRVTVIASVVPGPPVVLPAVILRSERGRVLSWGGRVPGLLRLAHTFELRPTDDGGTRVGHQEVFDGPGAAPLRLVEGRLHAEYTRMSERLRDRVESQPA